MERKVAEIAFKIMLAFALFSIVLLDANAAQPTQQFNKIYLNPFYRSSMSLNTNYSYTVNIEPPDSISSVKSAIINFDIYITPTVTFALFVNGQSCNNPSFVVSTTYASAGQGRVTFDCSNVINREGIYNLNLRVTQANTGAVSGWLDLTYMNNPKGSLDISGTEYSPGDAATVFVQLKDSQGLPIQNGSCYLDVWYPMNSSNIHPYTIQDAPMLKALGDDGIYYYDMVAPNELGVYMLSSKCSYAYNRIWIFPTDEIILKPILSPSLGVWTGDTLILNDLQDSNYIKCQTTGGSNCIGIFSFNVSAYGTIQNISSLNIYFAGQSSFTGSTLTMAYYNGTGYVNLPNTLSLVSTGATTTIPGEIDLFLTNSLPIESVLPNQTISLRMTFTGGGTYAGWFNWLSLSILSEEGTIQELKGSSEMHVTNISGIVLSGINITQIDLTNYTQISDYVWNYFNRTLTNQSFNFTSSCSVNISNNLNISINDTNLGNVTGSLDNIWGEINMGYQMIVAMVLFILALLILGFSKNTGLVFISALMFLVDFLMLNAAAMGAASYIPFIFMMFSIVKIFRMRNEMQSHDTAYFEK